jgi:hypothetical protein
MIVIQLFLPPENALDYLYPASKIKNTKNSLENLLIHQFNIVCPFPNELGLINIPYEMKLCISRILCAQRMLLTVLKLFHEVSSISSIHPHRRQCWMHLEQPRKQQIRAKWQREIWHRFPEKKASAAKHAFHLIGFSTCKIRTQVEPESPRLFFYQWRVSLVHLEAGSLFS